MFKIDRDNSQMKICLQRGQYFASSKLQRFIVTYIKIVSDIQIFLNPQRLTINHEHRTNF